jgi:hypothetical protein
VDAAVENDFRAIVLTIDAPGSAGRRERDLRTGFTVEEPIPAVEAATGRPSGLTPAQVFQLVESCLTWRDLEKLRGMSDLPILVKGLLTREDARLAVDAGVDGIVVSNHAGRQLDTVLAGIDALPEVVDEVGGEVEVLVDGGGDDRSPGAVGAGRRRRTGRPRHPRDLPPRDRARHAAARLCRLRRDHPRARPAGTRAGQLRVRATALTNSPLFAGGVVKTLEIAGQRKVRDLRKRPVQEGGEKCKIACAGLAHEVTTGRRFA